MRTSPANLTSLPTVAALLLIVSGLLLIGAPVASAAEPVKKTWDILDRQMVIRSGPVELGAVASLVVPDDMVFLGPEDAEYVNFVLLGNKNALRSTMGMIIPQELREAFRGPNTNQAATVKTGAEVDADVDADVDLNADAETEPAAARDWVFIITWADGHVPVDEALATDEEQLMTQLVAAERRVSQPQPSILNTKLDLLGWAEPPTYDSERNALIWPLLLDESSGLPTARRGRGNSFAGSSVEILNYQVRLLGARGYIHLVAVSESASLPDVAEATRNLITTFAWASGEEYASYRPGSDPLYPQGITSMIAGVVEGKAVGFTERGRSTWSWIKLQIGILIAIALGASWFITRYVRETKPRPRVQVGSDQPVDPNARRCPRCTQVLHQDARRCPSCGASTLAPR